MHSIRRVGAGKGGLYIIGGGGGLIYGKKGRDETNEKGIKRNQNQGGKNFKKSPP